MHEAYSPETVGDAAPAYAGKELTHANLVLEGGAMRGQFTAGVLDFLMDHDVWCENVVGTSAGSLNGYDYLAGEVGRTCFVNVKYGPDPRYLSFNNFARYGTVFGDGFVFEGILETDPFDVAAFESSPMHLYAVSSNIETGQADYHRIESMADIDYLKASCSMPLMTKIVEVDGKKLLDGGTCDSVPLGFSMTLGGSGKHIVVLTRDASFVRKEEKLLRLMERAYRDYPKFLERVRHRHVDYNCTYRWARELHKAGHAFVIQPPEPVTIGNIEHDRQKLFDLWEQGYRQTALQWEDLKSYLGDALGKRVD